MGEKIYSALNKWTFDLICGKETSPRCYHATRIHHCRFSGARPYPGHVVQISQSLPDKPQLNYNSSKYLVAAIVRGIIRRLFIEMTYGLGN